MTPVFIVLNAGSSSLKFQVFEAREGAEPRRRLQGSLRRPGRRRALHRQGCRRDRAGRDVLGAGDAIGHEEALMHLVSWLREHQEGRELVGHRAPGRPRRRGLFRPGAGRRSRPPDARGAGAARAVASAPQPRADPDRAPPPSRRCRRSPASTPPFTKASPTSRACSPCRARCANAACGATASTGCPTTTSRPS